MTEGSLEMSSGPQILGLSIETLLDAFATATQQQPWGSHKTGGKAVLRLIAGDASDRKFYRLEDAPNKAICMQFPKWEGGYGGDPISWLGMHSALKSIGIPVPEVLLVDPNTCCIWTEDFGDFFLNYDLPSNKLDIDESESQKTLTFYQQALLLLVQAQHPTNEILSHPAQSRFFDFEKLFFEMQFFLTHFVDGFLGINRSARSSFWKELEQELVSLCKWLESRPRVLCHRDYHLRNVMILDQQAKWIDFQDARMGPHTYDVVSLLRDSYILITPKTRKFLFDFFVTSLNERRELLGLTPIPRQNLFLEAQYMGLQRNIKAIGSFGYLATVKQKPSYLRYIPNTLANILSPTQNADISTQFPRIFELANDLNSGSYGTILTSKTKNCGIIPLQPL